MFPVSKWHLWLWSTTSCASVCGNPTYVDWYSQVITGNKIIHSGFVLYIIYDMAQRLYDVYAIVEISRLFIPIGTIFVLQYLWVHHLNDDCILFLMTHWRLFCWAPEQCTEADGRCTILYCCQLYGVMITSFIYQNDTKVYNRPMLNHEVNWLVKLDVLHRY